MIHGNPCSVHSAEVNPMKLSYVLKMYFKNALLVEADARNLMSTYKELVPHLHCTRGAISLKMRGTLPYVYNQTVYNCPMLISMDARYPDTRPTFTVVPTECVRLVDKHSCVKKNGEVSMKHLTSWTPSSSIMEAVRLVLLAFNKETPVCSVAPRQSAPKHGIAASSSSRQAPTTTSRSVASSAPTHVLPSAPSLLPTPAPAREPATVPAPKVPQKVTPPATAENDAAKFKEVEEVLRAAIDSARRKINADIRDARAALVKDYNYDMAKYDIHRLMMADWVPTCKDVGSSLKAQYAEEAKLKEALAKCSTQLRTLEEVDHYLTRVVEEVREVNALRDELDDARCSEASFQRNIKFQSTSDERLCRAVASEAAVDAMLETLTATFKRKQLSTKQYIHFLRLLYNEKFHAMHKRRAVAPA